MSLLKKATGFSKIYVFEIPPKEGFQPELITYN